MVIIPFGPHGAFHGMFSGKFHGMFHVVQSDGPNVEQDGGAT